MVAIVLKINKENGGTNFPIGIMGRRISMCLPMSRKEMNLKCGRLEGMISPILNKVEESD